MRVNRADKWENLNEMKKSFKKKRTEEMNQELVKDLFKFLSHGIQFIVEIKNGIIAQIYYGEMEKGITGKWKRVR